MSGPSDRLLSVALCRKLRPSTLLGLACGSERSAVLGLRFCHGVGHENTDLKTYQYHTSNFEVCLKHMYGVIGIPELYDTIAILGIWGHQFRKLWRTLHYL